MIVYYTHWIACYVQKCSLGIIFDTDKYKAENWPEIVINVQAIFFSWRTLT